MWEECKILEFLKKNEKWLNQQAFFFKDLGEVEDLKQEAFLVLIKILEKYPEKQETEIKKIFKVSFINHLRNLLKKRDYKISTNFIFADDNSFFDFVYNEYENNSGNTFKNSFDDMHFLQEELKNVDKDVRFIFEMVMAMLSDTCKNLFINTRSHEFVDVKRFFKAFFGKEIVLTEEQKKQGLQLLKTLF